MVIPGYSNARKNNKTMDVKTKRAVKSYTARPSLYISLSVSLSFSSTTATPSPFAVISVLCRAFLHAPIFHSISSCLFSGPTVLRGAGQAPSACVMKIRCDRTRRNNRHNFRAVHTNKDKPSRRRRALFQLEKSWKDIALTGD